MSTPNPAPVLMLRKGGKEGGGEGSASYIPLIRGVDAVVYVGVDLVVELGGDVKEGRKGRRRGGEGFLYTSHPTPRKP